MIKRRTILKMAAIAGAALATGLHTALASVHRPKVKVIYPLFGDGFAGMTSKMRCKDSSLFHDIEWLQIKDAIHVWREKYPEDLQDLHDSMPLSILGPHLIQLPDSDRESHENERG